MRIFNTNRFKWVKQHDSMQCRVSCLAIADGDKVAIFGI